MAEQSCAKATDCDYASVSLRPSVRSQMLIGYRCGPIVRILDDVLVNCQNAVTLESAHQLLRTLTLNQKFSGLMDTSEMLDDVLEGIGFGGLWQSSTFHVANDQERKCTVLTDRLIEVRWSSKHIDFTVANIL